MVYCIPDGSRPSLGPYYFSKNQGDVFPISSSNGFTNTLVVRPVYDSINLTNEVGKYYCNKLYSNNYTVETGTLQFPQGQLTTTSYNQIDSKGFYPNNYIGVFEIINGSVEFLGKNGFLVFITDESPIREILIYLKEPICNCNCK